MKRLAIVFAFILFLLLPSSVAAAECRFVLGFATLRDLIGHDIVGECLENEHYNHIGDSVQQTTGGLLVWRKTDNWTAFTDGYRTWINGPNGLVQRLNSERFEWEADYAPGGVAATPIPIATPPPTPTPDATAMVAQTAQNLPWVRDGLTGLEVPAAASLQELAVTSPRVLNTLLEARRSWLPPRNAVELATLEQLAAMSAIDAAGVQRLIRMPFLFDIEQADLEVLASLSSELDFNPSTLQNALSHPALGRATVKNLAVVATLLSLRRSDPEAAAAIEALPWVRDGIRSLSPLNRGYEFELNRVSDLIDWANRTPQTFANLIRKPWILNDFAPFPRTKAVRGVAGDLWADVIIGQPDFSQVSEEQVVPFKVFNPGGVVVDRSVSPGRAYVWDAGNNRILGIDLRTCYAGPGPCVADVVIGQPSGFDHSACNGDSNVQDYPLRAAATARTLCGITDVAISVDEEHTFVTMAVDAQGNLYVPDSLNNRVLKYIRPFETDSIADEVWGQSDFSGMVCNRDRKGLVPASDTLCFHSYSFRSRLGWFASGVEIDRAGNLWVADAANHRVLRFPRNRSTGAIAKQADLVLGQPDFRSNDWGNGLKNLDSPAAVRSDARNHVYVADKGNNRILVFKPPFTSGMSASSVFGSDFNRPTSLEIDPQNNGVWVNDSENKMLVLWDWEGASVLKVLGKYSYEPDGKCGDLDLTRVPGNPGTCVSGGGFGIDAEGNVLMPVVRHTQDVLRFPAPIPRLGSGTTRLPDKRLFYPPGGINFKGDRELRNSHGIAVYGDQLISSDTKRLLFWNGVAALKNGTPASGVVGETYWSPEWETCCGDISVDGAGRLWVLGSDASHFIRVYQLPLTENSVPIQTISTFRASFPVLGSSERVLLGPTTFGIPAAELHSGGGNVTGGPYIRGIAPVGNGESIWISDSHNHRILRLRNPLGEPVVDAILGQKSATGNKCNRSAYIGPWDRPQDEAGAPGADTLCYPGAVAIDRLGNLFVSDHSLEISGNWRLLVFPPHAIPAGNTSTIFAPAATKVFSDLGALEESYFAHSWQPRRSVETGRAYLRSRQTATWEPTFDSTNRMVVGYNSYMGPRFVGFYDNPLGPSTIPDGFLNDFGSMPYAATFDEDDNLYVADLNRNRILIYWKPFSIPH